MLSEGNSPKWEKWKLVPNIGTWEALALSIGVEPWGFEEYQEWYKELSQAQKCLIFDRGFVLERVVNAGIISLVNNNNYAINVYISMKEFVDWINTTDWDIPGELATLNCGESESKKIKKENEKLYIMIGLISKAFVASVSKYKHGDKPNVTQISDAVAIAIENLEGNKPYGFSDTSIRIMITKAISVLNQKIQ